MRAIRFLAAAAVVLAWGCASTLPPVEVAGRTSDLEGLAGEWTGNYTADGVEGGRGSIYFALVGGEDHAHGNVIMTPEGRERARTSVMDSESTGPKNRRIVEPRNIHFVEVAAKEVSGTLDPTWDAERDCWSWTVFRGQLIENTITGTFRTTYAKPFADVTGRWRVDRRRR
jgi:hypothetical protein